MLYTTRGIVLHTIKYSETSLVVKVYTELFGLQTYMINGTRGKKSKIKASIFQPLQLVEMVVTHKVKNNLHRIQEIRNNNPFTSIPYDIVKSSIALFITEILYKSIKEEEPNQPLFDFLNNSLLMLDIQTGNCANFHLAFLAQLTRYTGFFPQGRPSGPTSYFDLKEGIFLSEVPMHTFYMQPDITQLLFILMHTPFATLNELSVTSETRRRCLSSLILYYEMHISNLSQINSHKVLEEVIC